MEEATPLGPGGPSPRDSRAALTRRARHLTRRYRGTFSPETIASYLEECHDFLAARAAITAYLPILAERLATERLDALARTTGHVPKTAPDVLFVCTENSGRSQLAAALLRHRAPKAVRVHSAGTLPSATIDPMALRLLTEVGLGPDDEFPKPLTHEVVRAADVVVSLGCGDACPVLPGRRYYDWNLPDLKGLDIESARSVRDTLAGRIEQLAAEISNRTVA
ncbi:three-helix bundle dimerization domain-containing protein [Streptomyces sp. NPDC001978]|uniref:arsenate reductase/protein-tyrosine-phosphatase family protein n=1 Tax=Streptomyces sp. NPDC001978 TaxID=3364627 RepID=UPI0036A306EF